MKTKFILTLVGAAALTITSCGRSQQGRSGEAFATDSIYYADSLTVGKCCAKAEVGLTFPTQGYDPLVVNVQRWIATNMLDANDPNLSITDHDLHSDGKKLAHDMAEAFLADAKADLNEANMQSEMPGVCYELESDIYPIYNTDSLLTYTATTYQYTGGAHGMTAFAAQSFRKSNGDAIGFDMIQPDSLSAFYGHVRQALADYFEVPVANLGDALLVPVDSIVPTNPPYFTTDGVAISYQQYEIAPYSDGIITVTIPYGQLKPLMTPAAANLVK